MKNGLSPEILYNHHQGSLSLPLILTNINIVHVLEYNFEYLFCTLLEYFQFSILILLFHYISEANALPSTTIIWRLYTSNFVDFDY